MHCVENRNQFFLTKQNLPEELTLRVNENANLSLQEKIKTHFIQCI